MVGLRIAGVAGLCFGSVALPQHPVRTIAVRVPEPWPKCRKTCCGDGPVLVGLDAEGLTLNRNPIEFGRLGFEVGRQLEFREEKVVYFDVDDGVAYGAAIAVFDIARRAGAETVFATLPPNDR